MKEYFWLKSNKILAMISFMFLVFLYQNCSDGFSLSSKIEQSLNMSSSLGFQGKSEAVVINGNNLYSPDAINFKNKKLLFFGGWYEQGQTHDNIYVTECSADYICQNEVKVAINAQAFGFQHLNDPTVVQTQQGHLIMYMTGVPQDEPDGAQFISSNHVYYSTSTDGFSWAPPKLIAHDLWLPSATLNSDGQILLYGNGSQINSEYMIAYNLNTSGIDRVDRRVINHSVAYSNINVRWNNDTKKFEIFGELNVAAPTNRIDYLSSINGYEWKFEKTIVQEEPNTYHRTPGVTSDFKKLFYAFTRGANTENKLAVIDLKDLIKSNPVDEKTCSATKPMCESEGRCTLLIGKPNVLHQAWSKDVPNCGYSCIGGYSGSTCQTPPVEKNCVASKDTQQFIKTSIEYFKVAAVVYKTNSTVQTCQQQITNSVSILTKQGWPCAGSNTTGDYVSGCVKYTESLKNQ